MIWRLGSKPKYSGQSQSKYYLKVERRMTRSQTKVGKCSSQVTTESMRSWGIISNWWDSWNKGHSQGKGKANYWQPEGGEEKKKRRRKKKRSNLNEGLKWCHLALEVQRSWRRSFWGGARCKYRMGQAWKRAYFLILGVWAIVVKRCGVNVAGRKLFGSIGIRKRWEGWVDGRQHW